MTPSPGETATSAWFGTNFARLHPRLQALHGEGGVVRGAVMMSFGRSLAGLIGRRMARKLGTSSSGADHPLKAADHHDGAARRDRRFDDGPRFSATFQPVGHWPAGHWIEDTSAISLA